MNRINNAVLTGLVNNMSRVMGEQLHYERGSNYNGIAWKITNASGGKDIIIGQSARELYEKAHAYISGYQAAQDKAAQSQNGQ